MVGGGIGGMREGGRGKRDMIPRHMLDTFAAIDCNADSLTYLAFGILFLKEVHECAKTKFHRVLIDALVLSLRLSHYHRIYVVLGGSPASHDVGIRDVVAGGKRTPHISRLLG